MPHNSNCLCSRCSRPCASRSVEIPPTAMSHSAASDQEVFSQLEQEGRKMRAGVEECSGTVMLQHHHTSHCPFEWRDPPPPSGTHQLNLDANNPPSSSYSSPALSLFPSFISLSHPHCTLPHLSPWEPLWDWVLFL